MEILLHFRTLSILTGESNIVWSKNNRICWKNCYHWICPNILLIKLSDTKIIYIDVLMIIFIRNKQYCFIKRIERQYDWQKFLLKFFTLHFTETTFEGGILEVQQWRKLKRFTFYGAPHALAWLKHSLVCILCTESAFRKDATMLPQCEWIRNYCCVIVVLCCCRRRTPVTPKQFRFLFLQK